MGVGERDQGCGKKKMFQLVLAFERCCFLEELVVSCEESGNIFVYSREKLT